MRQIIFLASALLLLSSVDASAQHRVSNGGSKKMAQTWSVAAGARVGFGSMLQKSDVESDRTKGFDGAAEGVFYFYFDQHKSKLPQFGFRTGLSLGYRQNSISMPVDLTYKAADPQGYVITYHATADYVKETDRQFSIDIPVMGSAIYKDMVFLNLGLRFGIPLMSRYSQVMENPTLSATYDDFGVEISGEAVTGRVNTSDSKKKAHLDAASFSMCLSLESGYCFRVFGSTLQAGIYMDYGLVDNFKGGDKNFTDADPSVIDGASNTPTTVVVHSLTDSYVSSVGVFDIGVRATYTLLKKGGKKKSSVSVRSRMK